MTKIKCIDCGKELNPYNIHVLRCRKCYYKFICDSTNKPWMNKIWLEKQYYDNSLSFVSIAKLCGVAPSTIIHAFKFKFKLKPRERNLKGSNNPCWKGGRTMTNGYIELYHPEPHSRKRRNYVPEHVLVAENTLGRKLTPNDAVHHKNGIKTDNRPENLQVLSSRDHRILEHKLELFAKQIIYGDLAPHLKKELLSLFTFYLSKNG